MLNINPRNQDQRLSQSHQSSDAVVFHDRRQSGEDFKLTGEFAALRSDIPLEAFCAKESCMGGRPPTHRVSWWKEAVPSWTQGTGARAHRYWPSSPQKMQAVSAPLKKMGCLLTQGNRSVPRHALGCCRLQFLWLSVTTAPQRKAVSQVGGFLHRQVKRTRSDVVQQHYLGHFLKSMN